MGVYEFLFGCVSGALATLLLLHFRLKDKLVKLRSFLTQDIVDHVLDDAALDVMLEEKQIEKFLQGSAASAYNLDTARKELYRAKFKLIRLQSEAKEMGFTVLDDPEAYVKRVKLTVDDGALPVPVTRPTLVRGNTVH